MLYLRDDLVLVQAGPSTRLALPLGVQLARREPAPPPEPEPSEAETQAAAVLQGLLSTASQQQDTALALVAQAEALIEAHTPAPTPALHHPASIPESVRVQARQALGAGLILDLETTGLKKTDQVLELALMDTEANIVLQLRLNPGSAIPPAASAVHGIEGRHVDTLPSWGEALPLLRGYLAGRTVIAHNAKFESKFLPADWDITWVCTKQLADAAFGKWNHWEARDDWRKSGSLANRLRQCGLPLTKTHSAAGDCLSVLRLIRFIAGE